ERGRSLDPVRDRRRAADRPGAAHAIALHADSLGGIDRGLAVEPGDHGPGRFDHGFGSVLLHPGADLLKAAVGTEVLEILELRRGRTAVERVRDQHGVARRGEAAGHDLLRVAQSGDVGPEDHAGVLALGRVNEEAIHRATGRGEADVGLGQSRGALRAGAGPRGKSRAKTGHGADLAELPAAYAPHVGQLVEFTHSSLLKLLVGAKITDREGTSRTPL